MKSRYWTAIIYPESAPENWRNIIEELQLPCAISPLHDHDIIESSGELKKAHWHILISFPGPTTYKNVEKITVGLLKGTIPKKIISVRGMYRYLTHADNPEKYQYKEEDIIKMCGFDIELTTTEINYIKTLICIEIEERDIREYSDLINYYMEIGDYGRFEIAATHTYFFDRYISSLRNKKKACK